MAYYPLAFDASEGQCVWRVAMLVVEFGVAARVQVDYHTLGPSFKDTHSVRHTKLPDSHSVQQYAQHDPPPYHIFRYILP